MNPNDGGPAFPVATTDPSDGHQAGPSTWQFPGMTLRDYFAAHAPITLDDARAAFHQIAGNYTQPSGGDLLRILANMRADYAAEMVSATAKATGA